MKVREYINKLSWQISSMHTCMTACYLHRIQLRCPIDSWPHLSRACPCPSPLTGCRSLSKEESILVKKKRIKQTKNSKHHDYSHWQTNNCRLVNWPEKKLIILSSLRFSGNLFLQNPRDHLNLIGIWSFFWHFDFDPWRYFKTEPSKEKRDGSEYSVL